MSEVDDLLIIRIGQQWMAGTKTITITDMWLRRLDGQWSTWVAYEVKWKKRGGFNHVPWDTMLKILDNEKAVLKSK